MQYAITAKYVVTQTRYVTAKNYRVAESLADHLDGDDFDPDQDEISDWGIHMIEDVTEGE